MNITENEMNCLEAAADIAELAADGMTAGEIAAELWLPTDTVQEIINCCIIPAVMRYMHTEPFPLGQCGCPVVTEVLEKIFGDDGYCGDSEPFLSALADVSLEHFRTNPPSMLTESRKDRNTRRFAPESMSSRLLTVHGLFLLKADPGLSAQTLENLKVTESALLTGAYSCYAFLLDDHDAEQTADMYFRSGRDCGRGHLSVLICENPDRSMVSLVSEYSQDRNIPFVAGALLIHDLIKSEGGIYVCRPVAGTESYRMYEWKPSDLRTAPPVSYSRLSRAGYESFPGAGDGFVLRTYSDFRGNAVQTAGALGVSRQTAAVRLKKVRSRVRQRQDSDAGRDFSPVPDLSIATEYLRLRGNTAAAAEKLSMDECEFKKRAKRIIKCEGAVSDTALVAAGIVCPGDAVKAAELLGMTPGWYIRRMRAVRKRLSGPGGIESMLFEDRITEVS